MGIRKPEISSFTRELLQQLQGGSLAKSDPKKHPGMSVQFADPATTAMVLEKGESPTLEKSILNLLNGGPGHSIERLAFETNPSVNNTYAAIYQNKVKLLPDTILKRIAIQDSLVAAIVNARAAMLQSFGRPQPDRHSTGFKIEPQDGIIEKMSDEQKADFQKRVDECQKKLVTCGSTRNLKANDYMTFAQFLGVCTRNAIVVGRIAVEVIRALDQDSGEMKFHSFRPIDAGTIYRAAPYTEAAESVRKDALHLLEQIKNKDFVPEKFKAEEYSWIQVIDGRPAQAFTSGECLVYNFYPVNDIELDGYPLTPIDTAIADITTHINITNHNKLYFQTGRAARGMLVIKSEDVNEHVISNIKQQFNASINSVSNAWRMPVFGVGSEDEISWVPIDSGSRDMEFQYLSDSNSRVILSAFQMSPEELPGYAHLCLHPDTSVWTPKGVVTIGSLLGENREVDGFSVWTGKGWSEARAFVTGQRPIGKTSTSNGITIATSPEHRFRAVDDHGDLVWKQQKDLCVGDTILVNRRPIPGFEANIPSYNGKLLTVDMAEVLGWLTGDGTITVRRRGKKSHSKDLEFYYHHNKEVDIRERHLKILQAFGLTPKVVDRNISLAAIERQKRLCGFKSISSVRRCLKLYDTEFVQWLLDLGFESSASDKAIPDFIHGLPIEYRGAFLRGFFSADGSKDSLNTPSISIASAKTRENTKKLLLNMGIRTRACEGTHRSTFTPVSPGGPYLKEYVRAPSKLIVKDKLEFYERIGFLQAHKQPDLESLRKSSQRWDKVAKSVAVSLCDKLLSGERVYGHEARDRVRHALKEMPSLYRERSSVESVAKMYGAELPAWVGDYYQESVVALESSDEFIEMVDIEVFDDVHAFVADGLVVHNSRGTNNQALCLVKSSTCITEDGNKTLESLLADGEWRGKIWTGRAWSDARVFLTGEKPMVSTTLWNGSQIKSSPDHRFRVVGPEGEPVWVQQKYLKVGDGVLVNRIPNPGIGEIPSYGEKPLTEEMMEVLGWLTGDGNISIRYNKNTGNIKQGVLSWFYHHGKETDLWEKHHQTLLAFGLDPKHENHQVSEHEAADAKERYGFKSIAPNRLRNRLYDIDFVRWLLSLGFQSSTDGKIIPSSLHTLPIGHRQAFLRGFFSADGTCMHSKAGAARIVIHDDRLRRQTRDLLLGLGIRTQFHQGKLKQDIDGSARKMVAGQSVLVVKDKTEFYKQIGFLQAHKQPDREVLASSERKWERVPGSVVESVLGSSASRDLDININRLLNDGCSLSTLESLCFRAKVQVPQWLYEYHIEEVVEIEDLEEVVEMADVEVYDDEHAFVVDGVIVHNSESNNEYKLEAARDVGLRPLISNFEDFINARIFPLLDPNLAKICVIKLVGLDAETAEKESIRLQADQSLHMTYDEVLEAVEKDPVGDGIGGGLPMNPAYLQNLDKYFSVGEIKERFCGVKGAGNPQSNPADAYRRDPFWFQYQQLLQAQQQMAMQMQAQQQAAAQGMPPPGQDGGQGGTEGGGSGGPPNEDGAPTPGQEGPSAGGGNQGDAQGSADGQDPSQAAGEDLSRSLDQVVATLSKGERMLPPSRRRMLHQQRQTVSKFMEFLEDDLAKLQREVLEVAKDFHFPKE